MRHPFAGIIIPESVTKMSLVSHDGQANDQAAPRRVFLQLFAGAAAFFGLKRFANALDHGRKPLFWCGTRPVSHHRRYQLYLIVPQNIYRFSSRRRGELDVLGPYLNVRSRTHNYYGKRGYLAWAADDHIDLLQSAGDVREVLPMTGAVQPTGRSTDTLLVTLSPNSWRTKPDRETYTAASELASQWANELASNNVRVWANGSDRYLYVKLGRGGDKEAIQYVSHQPQVSKLQWTTAITSTALGEEGGPSTRALGEEGGRPVTTRALGEEGGSRPTTKALGEEGGRPTTMAIGEEGGSRPSTRAFGEEGGGRPSTEALGEEGGSGTRHDVTTFALGEEGGRRGR